MSPVDLAGCGYYVGGEFSKHIKWYAHELFLLVGELI